MIGSPALVLLALAMGCGPTPPSRRPDVVVVTLDTTRADHLGVYGYSRPVSPEIDRFALEAAVHRRAWSTASWTLPAHASILTGRHPASHGAHFDPAGDTTLGDVLHGAPYALLRVNRLGEGSHTLAELLRDAGYATGAFVASPWLAPVFGLLQGYEARDAVWEDPGGPPARVLTNRALAWVHTVPPGQPLHLLVNYFDAHAPYDPPPGFDDLPAARAPLTILPDAVNRGRALTPEQRAAYVDRYDGEIRYMDHHVGRLLRGLRGAGRYDAALVVLVADHGEAFGEHGLMGHGRSVYEDVLRVPLLIRYPHGRHGGTTVDETVSLVDLLPLITSTVGLPPPPKVEGRPVGMRELALAQVFRDPGAIRRWGRRFDRELVAGVRWPWKLITADDGTTELYRLDSDAHELSPRTDSFVAAELRAAVAELR